MLPKTEQVQAIWNNRRELSDRAMKVGQEYLKQLQRKELLPIAKHQLSIAYSKLTQVATIFHNYPLVQALALYLLTVFLLFPIVFFALSRKVYMRIIGLEDAEIYTLKPYEPRVVVLTGISKRTTSRVVEEMARVYAALPSVTELILVGKHIAQLESLKEDLERIAQDVTKANFVVTYDLCTTNEHSKNALTSIRKELHERVDTVVIGDFISQKDTTQESLQKDSSELLENNGSNMINLVFSAVKLLQKGQNASTKKQIIVLTQDSGAVPRVQSATVAFLREFINSVRRDLISEKVNNIFLSTVFYDETIHSKSEQDQKPNTYKLSALELFHFVKRYTLEADTSNVAQNVVRAVSYGNEEIYVPFASFTYWNTIHNVVPLYLRQHFVNGMALLKLFVSNKIHATKVQ